MQKRGIAAGACLIIALGACGGGGEEAEEAVAPSAVAAPVQAPTARSDSVPAATLPTAQVVLHDAGGEQVATAQLREQAEGVMVTLDATRLPGGQNGFHFHEIGRCEGSGFASAGSHFNPTSRQHGFENSRGAHLGDLPNLIVQSDGTATQSLLARNLMLAPGLNSVRGRSLVVHADRDDYRTDPSGNSGERVACGVVPSR